MVQQHFMWIASAALCDMADGAMPLCWERVKAGGATGGAEDGAEDGGGGGTSAAGGGGPRRRPSHFYYNALLGASQWEHPSLSHWRSVYRQLQALEKQSLAVGDRAAVDAHGPPPPTLWLTTDDPDEDDGTSLSMLPPRR